MVELTEQQISDILNEHKERGIDPNISKSLIDEGEYVCIGCGCSDSCACEGGCSWEDVDPSSGFGICSNPECKKLLPKYQK